MSKVPKFRDLPSDVMDEITSGLVSRNKQPALEDQLAVSKDEEDK